MCLEFQIPLKYIEGNSSFAFFSKLKHDINEKLEKTYSDLK